MQEKRYHHGDLKQELVSKGMRLLASDGYYGFSMRKLASLCGVSRAAPYKHFRSKDDIVSEIFRRYAVKFSDAIAESIGRYPTDARMRLIELSKQFIRFMVENPDYFRFVFMMRHGSPVGMNREGADVPGERQPFAIAYQCAEEYFRVLRGDGWRKDFLATWSIMQGYTLMLVNGTISREGDYLELAGEMMASYLDGICKPEGK